MEDEKIGEPGSEYPKALYKGDADPAGYNHSVETITACDEKAEAAARKEGYAELGAKPAAKGKAAE